MSLKDKNKLTNITVLEYLKNFAEENETEIITEILLSNNEYKISDYLKDSIIVNLFLSKGNQKDVSNYLKFAKFIFSLENDEFYQYWFLFSSAKLFYAYGDVIKNYFLVHILLLSNIYMTTSTSHIQLSEEIIFDRSFYITEVLKKSKYEDIFDILDKKRIYFEYVNNNELEKNRIVKLQRKENFTGASMAESMDKFAEENEEDIINRIYEEDFYYEIKEYEEDLNFVKSFLLNGDSEMISNYLKFAKIIKATAFDNISKYLLLLSSAKLYSSYGKIIENYLSTHKLLLSKVYMYTYMDRMFISEDVITDSSFYMREWKNGKNEDEMFDILDKRREDLECAYDGSIEDKKKIYH